MQNVILVIHILACLAMIGLVLVQKSEGGGLGIGGGGSNSLMSGRGAAGAIVRTTIIIGGIFFATSLALTSIANRADINRSGIERALDGDVPATAPGTPADLFDPSVSLLGDETLPSTSPEAADVIDPSAPLIDPTVNEVVPPADPGVQPEPAPVETNPQ